MTELKAFVLSDTNVNPLLRFLGQPVDGLIVKAEEGPYNQVYQVLMDGSHPGWNKGMDVGFIWTHPHLLFPSFQKLLNHEGHDLAEILADVDRFADLLIEAGSRLKCVLAATWSLPPHIRSVQAIGMMHETGHINVLMRMNLRLAERLKDYPHIILLDSGYWYVSLQGKSHDPKMYALGKIHYTRNFFELVASEVKAALRAVYGQSRKAIICDLDNTLWGGVIGDDGMENIKLGGHDPLGESFQQFQLALKRLKNRGILLALCSKNTESVALQMIENHPEMKLKRDDFSAIRINWRDKAENVSELIRELNVGESSVVFLDDHPAERERIRQAFPAISVPDLPEDITEYPVFLGRMNDFETLGITKEDLGRTEWFRQENERRELQSAAGTLEQWLESLQIVVTAYELDRKILPRAVQLLNKTNQFNLSTYRYTEEEYWEWNQQPGNQTYVFQVEDKFGDAGITGIISYKAGQEGYAEIRDFVMSCRIMGKQVELALLGFVLRQLEQRRIGTVRAACRPTEKNEPIRTFLQPYYLDRASETLNLGLLKSPAHITVREGGA